MKSLFLNFKRLKINKILFFIYLLNYIIFFSFDHAFALANSFSSSLCIRINCFASTVSPIS